MNDGGAPAPDKGPFTEQQIADIAMKLAAGTVARISDQCDVKASLQDWNGITHALAEGFASAISSTQARLMGCGMAWQAMLGPEDQSVIVQALDRQIGLLRDKTDIATRPGVMQQLETARARVATGLDPAPTPAP
jgi:hypothetical protein